MGHPPGDPGGGELLGRVVEVWRYPVKSLGGERLGHVRCEQRGLEGDRRWAIVGSDGRIGSGKTTRRFRRMPGLLHLTGHTDERGQVWVGFPDGARGPVEDPETAARVGAVVGEPVRLAEEAGTLHVDVAPLHLVTTGTLDDLGTLGLGRTAADRRRFRPNLLVEGPGSLEPPCRLRVGPGVVLVVTGATERCVMTTMAQPGLPPAPAVLGQLARRRDGRLGVYATVEQGGEVAVGDPVVVLG